MKTVTFVADAKTGSKHDVEFTDEQFAHYTLHRETFEKFHVSYQNMIRQREAQALATIKRLELEVKALKADIENLTTGR